MKSRRLVPLERKHLYAGALLGLSVAAAVYIGDLVQHGFSVHALLFFAAGAPVVIGLIIWAEWHADDRIESELRRSRRLDRGNPRPKQHGC